MKIRSILVDAIEMILFRLPALAQTTTSPTPAAISQVSASDDPSEIAKTPAKMQAVAVSINHEPAPNPCWQSSTAASQSDRSAPIAPSISPPPHAVSNAGIVGATYY